MLCQTAKKKQTIDINDGNVIHITRTNKEIRHIKYASEKNAHLATSQKEVNFDIHETFREYLPSILMIVNEVNAYISLKKNKFSRE